MTTEPGGAGSVTQEGREKTHDMQEDLAKKNQLCKL